jgi:6-pyruvoyltetrahydropterin/6-carboxytetrahydropterin synthase
MILTLYTEGYFDAAHLLKDYEGKCANLHGHTWKVSVWVKGDESLKDKSGILWDFGNLKKIIDELDHRNLNDYMENSPTAENITLFIYNKLKNEYKNLQFKVRIYEKIVEKESFCETGDFV